MKLSVSILDSNLLELGSELNAVVRAGADAIHLDVMDGHFVPNLSFGVPLAAAVRQAVRIPVHTHLMVREPGRMIPWFLAYSDMVGFHIETSAQVSEDLALIHQAGKKASISLNPDTPLEALRPFLNQVEDILVMSVFPGRGGQELIPTALDRVRTLRSLLSATGSQALISVDGGVNPSNCRQVARAGADWLIAGSAIFRSDDYETVVQSLKCSSP